MLDFGSFTVEPRIRGAFTELTEPVVRRYSAIDRFIERFEQYLSTTCPDLSSFYSHVMSAQQRINLVKQCIKCWAEGMPFIYNVPLQVPLHVPLAFECTDPQLYPLSTVQYQVDMPRIASPLRYTFLELLPELTEYAYNVAPPVEVDPVIPGILSRHTLPYQRIMNYKLFFPYHSFAECAGCLNTRELKSSQVAALRILRYISRTRPAIRSSRVRQAEAWRNNRQALIRYGIKLGQEYVRRGGSDNFLQQFKRDVVLGEWEKPDWIYEERTHQAHRSYLEFLDLRSSIAKVLVEKIPDPSMRRTFLQNAIERNSIKDCDVYGLNAIKHALFSRHQVLVDAHMHYSARLGWCCDPSSDYRMGE
jgi:hypothetical protein